MHYGREGMKWGQHIYTRNDIKRLKKFINSKQAKQDAKDWSFGLSHPVIAYNGNDYLERKKRTKIR